MNTNLIGTLSAAFTIASQLMVQVLGCSEATGSCSASWLTPVYAGWASMAFAFVLLVIKTMRPGGILAGLFNKTAVMVADEKAGPGTVTEKQVASH